MESNDLEVELQEAQEELVRLQDEARHALDAVADGAGGALVHVQTDPVSLKRQMAEFNEARPLALPALVALLDAPQNEGQIRFFESLAEFLICRGHLTYQKGGQYDALMRSYDRLMAARDARARRANA